MGIRKEICCPQKLKFLPNCCFSFIFKLHLGTVVCGRSEFQVLYYCIFIILVLSVHRDRGKKFRQMSKSEYLSP